MKKVKVSIFLCMLSVFCFLSGAVYTRAADEPIIIEKYLTQEGAVLYVKNLPDNAEAENMTYQVGTESCVVEESMTVSESSDPIYTLILCDTSLSSMRKSADQMKEVLKDVVANRMPGEKFAVMGMDKDAQLLCDYTNDYLTLKNIIDNITEKKQKTYVFSALYQAVEDLNALENAYKRIVVITDGIDSGGVSYGKSELEKKLEEVSYPIYALGISGKSNQEDLQTLYAISRATGAECFTLNETENLLDIVQTLSKDYALKRITVRFPETLMDGSTRNSQLNVEVNGTIYQAQTKITMPFVATVEKTEEGKIGEENKKENDTKEVDTTPEINLDSEKSDGKIHIFGMEISSFALGAGIALLCVLIISIVCLLKRKKKEEQKHQKVMENPYEELDKKLVPEPIQDKEESSQEPIGRKPGSKGTIVLGHISKATQEESMDSRVVKLEQHTFSLNDVKNTGRNWKCQFREGFIIGRNLEKCRLAITDDRAVSEQHCEITMKDNFFYIRDLNSSNGTKLNGNSIEPQKGVKISDGAILEIGQSKYQVRLE